MHKNFDNLQPFWPIIGTNGTANYLTAKFLAKLLKPFTANEFSLDDSFDDAWKINNISKESFEEYDSLRMYLYVALSILS